MNGFDMTSRGKGARSGKLMQVPPARTVDWMRPEWKAEWDRWRAEQEGRVKVKDKTGLPLVNQKWLLVPSFLKVKGLVQQHIESYNHFINVELRKILKANSIITSDVDPNFKLEYLDIRVGYPMPKQPAGATTRTAVNDRLTPHECRLRDATYAAPIYVSVRYTKSRTFITQDNVVIGRLPIMLRSNRCVLTGKSDKDMARMMECPLDPGGYFVVNGVEKVLLIQEQLSKNRVIVEVMTPKEGQSIIQASVTSFTHERKLKSIITTKNNQIYLKHNMLSEDVPIAIVLCAMGLTTDKEALEMIAGGNAKLQEAFMLAIEERQSKNISTMQEAREYIGMRYRPKRAPSVSLKKNPAEDGLDFLVNFLTPHVPVEDFNLRPKILLVAHMVHRVLLTMQDETKVDDKDYVGNKRFELAGQLLAILFEDLFKSLNSAVKTSIDKTLKKPVRTGEFDALSCLEMHASSISTGFARAISTGNWTLKRFRMDRAGISHVLSRLSYISALGMLTRVSPQYEKTRKISGPRALQPSQWGMLCPADTPEGESCGLIKNLALLSHITTDVEASQVIRYESILGIQDASLITGAQIHNPRCWSVYLNGVCIGTHMEPRRLVRDFRYIRRAGQIPAYISIYMNHQTRAVHIASDGGRVCRPLIIIRKGRSLLKPSMLTKLKNGIYKFEDFLALGVVEYLDVNEENDCFIALKDTDILPESTHVEIEPFTILGAVAGLIPYPHHNQSPRNTYQCAMGKQAIGVIGYNQFKRIDTLLHLMVYSQQPMVKTKAIELTNYDKLPAGQNAIVAVMSFSGYDIEDALILNKASLDRGFGLCQVFRKTETTLKRYGNGTMDLLHRPSAVSDENPNQAAREKNLGPEGLAQVGAEITSGEIIINKVIPVDPHSSSALLETSHVQQSKPAPISYKAPMNGYVDQVMVADDDAGNKVVKVSMRQTRRPEIGDKFSSRHGQKGVCGLIVPQADMPFTDAGICPDIIMNPHGFPSRMTVGKLIELLAGKAGVLNGHLQYGTAFGGSKVDDVSQILVDHGFSFAGKDYLTSGLTGQPLECYVYTGPIYYQKLKHMVIDKMHARARGPVASLTRQPTEGRSRDGGLRLGEMERDCLIAYGATQLLLERLMLSSDAFNADVCKRCGFLAYRGWCKMCESTEHVHQITLPYAAKLLIQELISMNILPRMVVEDAI